MLSPEPYERRVMDDMARMLKQIRTDAGYHTNAGDNVLLSDERVSLPEKDEEILLVVTDAEEELVEQNGYIRDVRLRLDIEVFVPVPREPGGRYQVRELTRRVLTDIRTAVLAGLRGGSFSGENPPQGVFCEGRTIAPLESGSSWMVAVQPVVWQLREQFQEF